MKLWIPTILFFLVTTGFIQDNKPADTWQLKKFESGIAIYVRNVDNSKFKELKSVTIYKSSLSGLISLIDDFESYPEWVYKCGVSKTIIKNSDTDLIHYQSVTAPWPVENRDFVVQVRLQQDPVTKVVTQTATSIPDYVPGVAGHIRIREFKAQWILIPLKNGNIEADYQLLVNPGGILPAWLVNLAVIDGPFETALNMKTWLTKEKYQKASLSFIKEP